MLLTLVKFNDGGKIYLENIDGDTFGFRFTHKILMGLHLGYKISLKNFVMFMWVRPDLRASRSSLPWSSCWSSSVF